MSEHELPEDLDQWPNDPFELLGVSREDEPITVKRAYTRLIRRYKPEQFPAHFMRLRQAFETIRDSASTNTVAPIAPSVFQHERKVEREPEPPQAAPIPPKPPRVLSQETVQSPSQDKILRLVAQGDVAAAVELLRSPALSDSEIANARLIEYWLTKILKPQSNDSDAGRVLIENLYRYRRMPGVLALARHELHSHPTLLQVMNLDRCVEGMLSFDGLSEVLKLRWDVALRESQFDIVSEDWKLLSNKYFDFERLRTSVALLLVDYLAWSPDEQHQTLVRELTADLEQSLGQDNSQVYALDRLEELVALRAALARFEELQPQWKQFGNWAPAMWNQASAGYAADVTAWLVKAQSNPTDTLRFFDAISPFAEVSLFYVKHFEALINAVNRLAESTNTRVQQAWALSRRSTIPSLLESEQIEEFLASYNDQTYEEWRAGIVRFCIEQNITPRKIAGYIEGSQTTIARFMRIELMSRLQEDDSLLRVAQLLHRFA